MSLTPVNYITPDELFNQTVANQPHTDLELRDEEIFSSVISTSGLGLYKGYHSGLSIVCDSDDSLTIVSGTSVSDDTGEKVITASGDITVSITSTGSNGLDTGMEANDTWYYIWMIRGLVSGTSAGLLSESYTSPTMPAGYSYKRLIGAVRNDSSGDFYWFIQHNNQCTYYNDTQTVLSTTSPATSYTTVDCTDYVPVVGLKSLSAIIRCIAEVTGGESRVWTHGVLPLENLRSSVMDREDPSINEYFQPLDSSGEFSYKVESLGGFYSWTNYGLQFRVHGYKFPL